MGLIDNIRRIVIEDFPEKDRDTVGKIAQVVNGFMEQMIREFNGNVNFSNLDQDIVEYTVTVNASGVPIGNNLVRTSLNNPKGSIVVRADNKDNPNTYPTTTPFVSFDPNGNILKIKKISGLQANNKYLLTIMIIP